MIRLILIFALLAGARSHAVDKVGQGAGISENNILFAYGYLESYIQLAMAKTGYLDDEERGALEKIAAALPQERRTVQQIQFKSTKDGLFMIDGRIRVAKTFTAVGSPIFFNLDLLYKFNGKEIEGISLATAASLLVHEMGHHHGYLNHDWLDALGQKVSRPLSERVDSNILGPDRRNIEVVSIAFGADEGPSQVYMSDGPNMYDLGPQIFNAVKCPLDKGAPSTLTGLFLWNFSWRERFAAAPKAVGLAKLYCRKANGETWEPEDYGVQIQVNPQFDRQSSTWLLNPAYFSVRQVTCADQHAICGWRAAYDALKTRTEHSHLQKEN